MIGVFDSGVGGLFALRRLQFLAPRTDLCYFADAAHLPYGEKSEGEICAYVRLVLDRFRAMGASALLCACGTASSVALPRLSSPPLPVFGVIDGAVEEALSATKNGRIGVLATAATVRRGAFAAAMQARAPRTQVCQLAAPQLVMAAEGGGSPPPKELAALVAPLRNAGCDTVILACTHFAHHRAALTRVLGGVSLVDCGEAAAERFCRRLPMPEETGRTTLFTTGDPRPLRNAALRLGVSFSCLQTVSAATV